jgi:hypothetical protein
MSKDKENKMTLRKNYSNEFKAEGDVCCRADIHKRAQYTTMFLLLLLLMLFTGCLSHSFRGLVEVDSLPDKSLIGISYEDLIARYGAPDRIIPLDQANPVTIGPPAEFPPLPKKQKSGDFMANYSFISSYDILLYYRDRGYSYTFVIKDGKVSSFTSLLTIKTSGIGFRNMSAIGGAGLLGGSPAK